MASCTLTNPKHATRLNQGRRDGSLSDPKRRYVVETFNCKYIVFSLSSDGSHSKKSKTLYIEANKCRVINDLAHFIFLPLFTTCHQETTIFVFSRLIRWLSQKQSSENLRATIFSYRFEIGISPMILYILLIRRGLNLIIWMCAVLFLLCVKALVSFFVNLICFFYVFQLRPKKKIKQMYSCTIYKSYARIYKSYYQFFPPGLLMRLHIITVSNTFCFEYY